MKNSNTRGNKLDEGGLLSLFVALPSSKLSGEGWLGGWREGENPLNDPQRFLSDVVGSV